MRITYYPNGPWDLGSSRLRVWRIQRWLLEHGIDAKIMSSPLASDIIVFQKIPHQGYDGMAADVKKRGITTVFDEDDKLYNNLVELSDYITVDTESRGEWIQNKTRAFKDITVINCPIDYIDKPLPKRIHKEKKALDIVWWGGPANLPSMSIARQTLLKLKKEGYKFTFTYISGGQGDTYFKGLKPKRIPWQFKTFSETLRKFDLGIVTQVFKQKSEDKIIEGIVHNLGVVGTANPAGIKLAKGAGIREFVCSTEEEWYEALKKMFDPEVRNKFLDTALDYCWKNYCLEKVGNDWVKLFNRIMREKK